jgi:hypothetical protein
VGKPERKIPSGRPTPRLLDNVKLDRRETEWGGMDWIDIAEDRDQWRALVNTVMNLLVPNTVELGYNNISYCDTSPIASNTQWYELIPHKATVFIPCLVRHSEMHQPHI